MIWIVLLIACLLSVAVFAVAAWILVGWIPAAAQPSDRLERLRRVEKR